MLLQLERPNLVRHTRPLSEHVTLTISVDQTTHYVGEPLKLRLTVRNEQGEPIRGYFALDPAAGAVEISYRKDRSEFQRLGRPKAGGDLIQRPKNLEANSELSHETVLAFDQARQQPLFSEPGLYEIRAIYRDMPNDANSLLESNTVTLKVGPPPDSSVLDSWTKVI